GVPLDLHHLVVLDKHVLGAADRAVWAHRLDHAVCVGGAGMEVLRPRRFDRRTSGEPVAALDLAQHRPATGKWGGAHRFASSRLARSRTQGRTWSLPVGLNGRGLTRCWVLASVTPLAASSSGDGASLPSAGSPVAIMNACPAG